MQRENFKALKLEMEVKKHQLEALGVLGERYVIKNMTLTKIYIYGEAENSE